MARRILAAPAARPWAIAGWLLALFAIALPALAQNVPPPSDAHHDWAPAVADQKEHDWIKLDTGEWLRGEVKLIQHEGVEFDSDKLDDLQLDWDDISEMRIPKQHTFRFTGRRIVTGSAEMRGHVFRIRTGDGVQEFERDDFVSMVRGSGRELDYWSMKIGIGLSGQVGNTDQLSFNASFDLLRETALTRGAFSYTGNVATQQDEISANNHRATFVLDYYLSKRLYIVVPNIEAFKDEFQNIDLRLTPAVGLGYDVIWRKKLKWRTGLSVGYQATQYRSVAVGDEMESDAVLQLGTNLDVDLPDRFEWTTDYQVQLIVTDLAKTSQHVDSTLSFDFWGPLDFDTTFQWDWVASPVADAQGNIPVSSDFRISVGFALDLR